MKKLNVTFDIENDLAEHQLRHILEGMGAKYIKTLPETEHLKDNDNFKKLKKAKKQAEIHLYEFINNNRL
jgi:hypothetical protein